MGAAAVGSLLFLFGGINPPTNTPFDTIQSFDTSAKTNSWTTYSVAKLPVATYSLSATTIGTDIYLTGGRESLAPIKTVYKYDARSTKRNISPVPTGVDMVQPRSYHATFFDSTSNRLYAVGGFPAIFQDAVEFWDLDNPTGPWVSANAPMQTQSTIVTGALIGSKFYIASIGILQVLDLSVPSSIKWTPFSNNPVVRPTVFQMTGPTKIVTVDTIYTRQTSFYDTTTDTWVVGGDSSKFPGAGVSNPSSTVVNGELYVLSTSSVRVLNAAGTAWTTKDSLSTSREGSCMASDGTNIYLYGGSSGPATSNTLYLMETTKPSGSQWSLITPASGSITPTAVMNCAAVIVSGKLIIFGGQTTNAETTVSGRVQTFDIASKKWESSANKITPRTRLSAVFLKGFVFVIGGSDGTGPVDIAQVYDPVTKAVSTITDMPTPRYSLGSFTDGSSIFSVGGIMTPGANIFYFASLEKLRAP